MVAGTLRPIPTGGYGMDATVVDTPTPPAVPVSAERRKAVLLEALRLAASGGEHRLFRGGKLPGLFPARGGPLADVALAALADGYLETTRTEVRGKVVTEWVRVTPKAIKLLHDTDSPLALIRDLTHAVNLTRDELQGFGERVAGQIGELAGRLDALTARLVAAQRRADLSAIPLQLVWADSVMHYLDCRPGVPCPLSELYRAIGEDHPGLTLAEFHAGLLRLQDARALRLTADGPADDPEYAVLVGTIACHFAVR